MAGNLWTDDVSDLAASLWREGHTGGQIANVLAARGVKFSRNAVIGRLFRMGLVGGRAIKRDTSLVSKRNCQRLRRMAREKPRAATVKAKPQAVAPAGEVEPLNVTFDDLQPYMCKAVTDSTRFAQRFCGHVRADASSYCETHMARFRAQPLAQAK